MNTDLINLIKKAIGDDNASKFALYSGVTQSAISKILSGARNPTPSTLQKIASRAHNGVTYNDLMVTAGYLPYEQPDKKEALYDYRNTPKNTIHIFDKLGNKTEYVLNEDAINSIKIIAENLIKNS